MLILTLRTDKPEAEIGLYDDKKKLAYITWQAHRQLAETLHQKIENMLKDQAKHLEDIKGVIVYKGPGSFTGLRIGVSVANALGYSLNIAIVGTHEDWIERGIERLQKGEADTPVLPEYGQPAATTPPRS